MEENKVKEIINNQLILNKKLDMILSLLYANKSVTNCQMFIQGLTLADIMKVEDKK